MQTLALNTTTANTIISEVMRELLPAGSDAMHNLGEALLDGSTLDKQQIHALLQTLANNPALIKYADKKANNIRRTKAKRTAKKAVEESNSASASWRWVSQDHYHTNGARKRNRRKPLASATATANNVPTGPNVSRRQPQPQPQPRTAPVVASIPTSTTSPDVETYQTVPVVSMTPVYLESQEVDHDGHRSLGSLSAVELDLQANYLTMSSPSSSYYSDSEYSLSSSENPSSPFESSSSPSPSSSTSSTSLFEAFQQGEEDAVAWALEEAANFASQIIPSAAAQLPPFDATLPASTTSSSSSSSTTSDEGARSIDAFFSELAQWGDLPPLDMAN